MEQGILLYFLLIFFFSHLPSFTTQMCVCVCCLLHARDLQWLECGTSDSTLLPKWVGKGHGASVNFLWDTYSLWSLPWKKFGYPEALTWRHKMERETDRQTDRQTPEELPLFGFSRRTGTRHMDGEPFKRPQLQLPSDCSCPGGLEKRLLRCVQASPRSASKTTAAASCHCLGWLVIQK